MRDSQRSALYAAEVAAFTDTRVDETLSLYDFQTLAGMLFADPWWVAATNGAAAKVVAARSDARRSVAAGSVHTGWTIRVAPGHSQPPTLSHEAAHVLIGVTGHTDEAAHGPAFRAAHLAVAGVLLGAHGASLLSDAYRAASLRWLDITEWQLPTHTGTHGLHGRWRSAIAG